MIEKHIKLEDKTIPTPRFPSSRLNFMDKDDAVPVRTFTRIIGDTVGPVNYSQIS